MKSLRLIALLSIIFTSKAFSQQQPQLAVTDQELLKYATAIDSINEMSASVRLELADMVKNGTSKVSTARYNELSKIITDETALQEAKATPEEIEFVKQVVARKTQEMDKINSTYQTLAKDYVTPAVFNKVKKALVNDPILKKRYDSLMIELGKDDPAADQ